MIPLYSHNGWALTDHPWIHMTFKVGYQLEPSGSNSSLQVSLHPRRRHLVYFVETPNESGGTNWTQPIPKAIDHMKRVKKWDNFLEYFIAFQRLYVDPNILIYMTLFNIFSCIGRPVIGSLILNCHDQTHGSCMYLF